MADKLITIATFDDSILADLAKQLLDDAEIRSVLVGRNTADTFSGISAVADTKLQTLESDAQKALEILRATSRQED